MVCCTLTGICAPLNNLSIHWCKRFAIAVAAAAFGAMWKGKWVMLHYDNLCMVEVLKGGTCKNELIMDFARHLFYVPDTILSCLLAMM